MLYKRTIVVIVGVFLFAAVLHYAQRHARTTSMMIAIARIEKEDGLRQKFAAAHKAVKDLGAEAIVRGLSGRPLQSEAEQILAIAAGRSGCREASPLLEEVVAQGGLLMKFAQAALDKLPTTKPTNK